MNLRHKLLSLVAGLLYLAPFLAGLANAPLAMLVAFSAIFLLWLVVMRPAILSHVEADGKTFALSSLLALTTLLQMMLVMVAFILGRGMATLLDGGIALPVWVPIVMALAAIPLGKLIWTPEADIEATADLLDGAADTAEDMEQRNA